MSIRVAFRGPMLVVTTGDKVGRILIPDASDSTNPVIDARKHTPGWIWADANTKEKGRGKITGSIVVSDGSAGMAKKMPSIRALISLQTMVKDAKKGPLVLLPDNDASIVSVVTLRGGSLATRKGSDHIYEFPGTFNQNPPEPAPVPLISEWTGSGNVTVTVDGKPIPVVDDDRVYIGNFDKFDENDPNKPHVSRLEHGQANCQVSGTTIDTDFRWCFWVTRPKNVSDFQTWLDGQKLPAPSFECEPLISEFNNPDSGDCFHARWDE